MNAKRVLPHVLVLVGMITAVQVSLPAFGQENTVTFDNRSDEPALVKLVGPSHRVVEVATGEKRTVSASAGQYHILVRYGTSGRYRYAKGDNFKVTETATQRSQISITLHKVIGGNYGTRAISEQQFGDSTTGPAQAAPAAETNEAASPMKRSLRILAARWLESCTHEDFSPVGTRRPEIRPSKESFLLAVETELYLPKARAWDISQILLQTEGGQQLKPTLYRLGDKLFRLAKEGGLLAVTKGAPKPILLHIKVTGNKPYEVVALGGWPGAEVTLTLVYKVPGNQRPARLLHKKVVSQRLSSIFIGKTGVKAVRTGDLTRRLWTSDGMKYIRFQPNGRLSYGELSGTWKRSGNKIAFSIGQAKHAGIVFPRGIAVTTEVRQEVNEERVLHWTLFPVEPEHTKATDAKGADPLDKQ